MRPATCVFLAFQRVGQQRRVLERLVQQRIDGDDCGNRGCRRASHAGLQRYALVNLQRRAVGRARGIPERLRGDGGRILLRVARQVRMNLAIQPPDFRHRDSRRLASRCDDAIAGAAGKCETQHVKADADVADRRRCERRHRVRHSRHRC